MKFTRQQQVRLIIIEVAAVLICGGVVLGLVLSNANRHPAAAGIRVTPSTEKNKSPDTSTPTLLLPTAPLNTGTPVAPAIVTASATDSVVDTPGALLYTVQPGDTLSGIALKFKVSEPEILAANPQVKNRNMIQAGQTLRIPQGAISPNPTSVPQITAAATRTPLLPGPGLQPYTELTSYLATSPERLESSYPLTVEAAGGRLILHYQPGAFVDKNLSSMLKIFQSAYQWAADQADGPLSRVLDVYAAGSLFYENENLRGFTQSGNFRTFLLIDGTGNAGERGYAIAHELTHIFAYHKFGKPSSAMIQEGFATYVPQNFLVQAGFLPLYEICALAKAGGRLVPIPELVAAEFGPPYFAGHISNFLNYNLSACFVQYLVDTYGIEKLVKVYPTGDYSGVYGSSLAELDASWQKSLDGVVLTIDANLFVVTLDRLAVAYQAYFERSNGGKHADWQIYLLLDQARMAVDSGQLEIANEKIAEVDN